MIEPCPIELFFPNQDGAFDHDVRVDNGPSADDRPGSNQRKRSDLDAIAE